MMAKAKEEHAIEDMDTGSQGASGALEVMLGTQSSDPNGHAGPKPRAFQMYPAPPTRFTDMWTSGKFISRILRQILGLFQKLLVLSWRLGPKARKLGLRLWRLVWPPQAKSLK